MKIEAGHQSRQFVAVIPARGGSKGLPGKNIAMLAGKPLLAWTIEAALQSYRISRVIVSSDDQEILEVAAKSGAECIQRPPELASDESGSEVVIEHVLATIGESVMADDVVVFLQPTSPLRDASDIDSAIDDFSASGADALISVTEPEHHPLKCFTIDQSGHLKALLDERYPFMRRQDLPACYRPNGAIYLISRAVFEKQGFFSPGKTIPFVMPQGKSIDIDVQADLQAAEAYLCKHG